MKEKEKNNIFLKIITILFLIFISLYLLDNLGYYNIASKNKIITEKKMKEFERDIQEGKKIDLKEYTRDETNYKNIYSEIGYNTSMFIDKVLNKSFSRIGKILKELFK